MKSGLIEQLKDRITCPDYMQREHGSQIRAGRCKSFRPDAHNESSLMVNDRDWFDFGSGIGGDIIDLAAHDKFNGDKGAAIRYLAEKWGLSSISSVPHIEVVFRSYLRILDLAADFWHSHLRPEHINYLHGRGLSDATIDALRIGWSDNPCDYLKAQGFEQQQIADSGILSFVNRLMIPYQRNGKAVYLIGRASVWPDAPSSHDDAKYMKLFRSDLSEHPIWGADSLRRPGPVIIAEGIFDAISCWQENFPVVTAVTGAFSAEQKKDLFPALKGRDVIVCMDFDPETHAGQKFTEKLADELFEAGIHVSACFLQGDGKKVDISDLYAHDPSRKTLDDIFAKAKNWDQVKLSRIADIQNESTKRSALTVFLRRCATVFDWPTVAQLIEDAEDTGSFAGAWLKELAKTLNRAPKELVIVEEFKKKFDCVYHDSLGWYEYGGTRWEQRSEHEIRQKIAELYGQYRTARNVDSVFRLLKAELIRRELFDMNKELLNFPNGMFNVETGKMLPHSRDYYSSIQMAYPYDPDATCPEWDKFLEDVTAGDPGRHNLIQEMFGYCLTKDARYQKCFCMIGTGANGKSVLLTVLEAMVGEANTSHIEIAFLNSDFQRIKLFNSLVNICNDMKTDVSGTESFLKAIVAGDPINGCYKGENFVDFRPFCKMIFSANRMLTAREVDYSFLRRFCFIEFPVKFVDGEPDESKGEMKKQPNIVDSILKELPGIFNWAYQGLKCLREQGRFTETSDQTTMTRELVTMANPLISFCEDVVGNGGEHWAGTLNRKEVYQRYSEWCRETNTMPMSARSFWPRLRQIFPFHELRTSEGRFLTFDQPRKFCGEIRVDPAPESANMRGNCGGCQN